MKTILAALAAAMIIASQCFTPASAAEAASSSCGDTYTVQPGDYLVRIAANCGTTVADIMALNSQIYNQNIIYSGMVLRLTSSAPATTYYPTYTVTYPSASNYGRVRLSSTIAEADDTVTVYVSGFPSNAEIDYRVGQRGEDYSVVYDGTTSSSGTDTQTITIPSEANRGEYWVVEVITTSLATVTDVYSAPIYISNYYQTVYYSYARVTLSATHGAVGDQITVHVSGFPADAEIDFRLGKSGEDFSVAYDATTSSSGTATQVITIPSGAVTGDYWVVKVITTERKTVTQATSASIHITD